MNGNFDGENILKTFSVIIMSFFESSQTRLHDNDEDEESQGQFG